MGALVAGALVVGALVAGAIVVGALVVVDSVVDTAPPLWHAVITSKAAAIPAGLSPLILSPLTSVGGPIRSVHRPSALLPSIALHRRSVPCPHNLTTAALHEPLGQVAFTDISAGSAFLRLPGPGGFVRSRFVGGPTWPVISANSTRPDGAGKKGRLQRLCSFFPLRTTHSTSAGYRKPSIEV